MIHLFNGRFIQSLPVSGPPIPIPIGVPMSKRVSVIKAKSVPVSKLIKRFPKQFALRAQVKGRPLTDGGTQARAYFGEQAQAPLALYGSGAHLDGMNLTLATLYAGFEVVFTGQTKGVDAPSLSLFQRGKGSLQPGHILLKSQFGIQTQPLIELHYDPLPNHQWRMTPPGQVASCPLWSYAGTINKDTLEMEQLFFTVIYNQGHTQVQLYKGSALKAHGVDVGRTAQVQGRTFVLMDALPTHTLWSHRLQNIAVTLGTEAGPTYAVSHLEPLGDGGCWIYVHQQEEKTI